MSASFDEEIRKIHAFSADGTPSGGAALGLLPYATKEYVDSTVADADLEAHVQSATPHPHYDDMPSLTLLFKNRLV